VVRPFLVNAANELLSPAALLDRADQIKDYAVEGLLDVGEMVQPPSEFEPDQLGQLIQVKGFANSRMQFFVLRRRKWIHDELP
jgi:hypothetical protein